MVTPLYSWSLSFPARRTFPDCSRRPRLVARLSPPSRRTVHSALVIEGTTQAG